jgi:hypothetical protein
MNHVSFAFASENGAVPPFICTASGVRFGAILYLEPLKKSLA